MTHALSSEGRRALEATQEWALRFNHRYIGTEHILLGLTEVAPQLFDAMEVSPERVVEEVAKLVGPSGERVAAATGKLPLTERSETVMELAGRAAGHGHDITPSHLLLALAQEGEGVGAHVLKKFGIGTKEVERVEGELPSEPSAEEEQELTRQQVTFWRKLGHMIGSGVPIVETFEVIAEEMAATPVGESAKEIATAIGQGGAIYEVLLRYPGVFSPSVVRLVRSGEAAGDLDKKALLIADGLEQGVFPVGGAEAGEEEIAEMAESKREEPGAQALDVRRMTNSLLLEAVRNRASDIHLEAVLGKGGEEDVVYRARLRIDGVLSTHRTFTPGEYKLLVARMKLMANLDLSDEARRRLQLGRILLKVEGREIDLRVSTAPARFGEMVAVRVLDRGAVDFSLDRLGFGDQHLRDVRSILHRPSGLFIVTGPAGSGKTTILYSLLSELDPEKRKICTAEDPIEYDLTGISQVQINMSVGLTFPSLVRAFLRSDPDVIMMGEIRDQEGAWIAHAAALTGHLVFSTLHTNDAPSTLRRLVDIGVQQWLVADAVIGVLACRLVRLLCPKCRKQSQTTVPELQRMDIPEELKSARYYEPVGCDACRGTGYRGRTGVHELLLMTDEFKQAFIHETDLSGIREVALKSGMVPMVVDALEKARQGITSVAEVMRVVLLGL